MTEPELVSILNSLDAAIEIYRNHPGRLDGPEVSVKSMLTALQLHVTEQLTQVQLHQQPPGN